MLDIYNLHIMSVLPKKISLIIKVLIFSFVYCHGASLTNVSLTTATASQNDELRWKSQRQDAALPHPWKYLDGHFSRSCIMITNGITQLFARSTNGILYERGVDHWNWQKWPTPVALTTSDPACVCNTAKSIYYVTVRGYANDMYIRGDGFTGFASIGGHFASGPAIAAFDKENIHVFARGFDNRLYTKSSKDGFWEDWKDLGGFIVSEPAAVAKSSRKVYVVTQSKYNYLEFNTYDDGKLTASKGFDFYTTSPAAVTLTENGRVDIFVRGIDFALWTAYSNNVNDENTWTDWKRIGGLLGSGPSAVYRGGGVIEIVANDIDNRPHLLKWDV